MLRPVDRQIEQLRHDHQFAFLFFILASLVRTQHAVSLLEHKCSNNISYITTFFKKKIGIYPPSSTLFNTFFKQKKTAQNINFEQSFLLFFHIRTVLEFETHTPTTICKVVSEDAECAYFACILHMGANASTIIIIAHTHNTQSL